ncbi:unnamed protein product [Umbelopsis vinacea]
MRFSLLIAVSALLSAGCVNAVDERLDYKLAKGQTADQFCNTWNSACNSYIHSHYPTRTPGTLCEAGPTTGEVQAYCVSYTINAYTTQLAKKIGATPA